MEERKKLSLIECIAVLIGGMIGSAIFSLSGVTMVQAGPSAILSWILGAVIMVLYGLILAELACRYPKSGGVYVFTSKAYEGTKGRILGWTSCWATIATNIIAVAFAAIYVGTYLSVSFPCFEGLQIPIAIISVVICFILNCIDFTVTGKINLFVVILLIATMLIYMGFAFFGGSFDLSCFKPFFSQGSAGSVGMLTAIPIAIVGYTSIVSIAFMTEEIRNPEKTIPVSMMIGGGIVSVLYALMIFATLGLITASWLMENQGMEYIPVFAACFTKLSAYPWLSAVISTSAVLALLSTMLVCLAVNTRAIQASSEDKVLPSALSRKNRFGISKSACLASAVPALVISCFPSFTEQIVNLGAMINCIPIIITVFTLSKARKNSNNISGFTLPGKMILPWILLLVLVACNLGSIASYGFKTLIFTLVVIILGGFAGIKGYRKN